MAGETIQFTDTSKCWDEDAVNGADCAKNKQDNFLWTFPNGIPNSTANETPTVKFIEPGYYNVILQVTDGDGHTCSHTQSVHVNYPLPRWREIRPF